MSISAIYEYPAYGLSDFQIKEICKKKQRRLTCIKQLKFKKSKWLKGNKIEIPVIPYKK